MSRYPVQFPSMMAANKTVGCTLKFKTTKELWEDVKSFEEDSDGHRGRVCVGGSKRSQANLLVRSSPLVNSGKRRPDMCLDGYRSKKQKMDLLKEKSSEGTEGKRHIGFYGGSKPSEKISARPSMASSKDNKRPSKRQNMDRNSKLECGSVERKLKGNMYFDAEEFADGVKMTFENAKSYNPPSHDVHRWAEILDAIFRRRWKLLDTKLKLALKNDAGVNLERTSDHHHSDDFKLDYEVKCTLASHANGFALDLDGPGVALNEEKSPHSAITPVSNEGWMADIQMSPRKVSRAAMLKSRFADTIFKATHLTLQDHGTKCNLSSMQQEKLRLEKEQLEEKARIEAQVNAAEAPARRKELDDLKTCVGGSKRPQANLLVKSSTLGNSGKRRPNLCLDGHRSKKQKIGVLKENSSEDTERKRLRAFVGGSKPSVRISAKPSMAVCNDKQSPSKRQNMGFNLKLECVALTKAPMPEKLGHSKSRPGQMQIKPGKTALNGCSSLSKADVKEHNSRRPLASANLRQSIGSTEAKCSCVGWTCRCPKNSVAQTSTTTSDISLERSSDHNHSADFKVDCEVKGTFASHANGFALDLDGPGVALNEEKSSHSATTPVSNEGWMADIQMSPRKALRAAMLKSRFADTIFKATHPTLQDHGKKCNLSSMQQEKLRLEKEQLEEKARIEAQIKATEAAARMKELDDLKMRRERERKAARMALEKMERSVDLYSTASVLRDLEILVGLPVQAGYPSRKPLERLGLYIKDMYFEEDEDEDAILKGEVEEGEILS